MNRTVDYTALTRHVSRDERRAFRAAAKSKPQYASLHPFFTVIIVAIVGFFVLMAFVSIGGAVFVGLADSVQRGFRVSDIGRVLIPLAVFVAFGLVGFTFLRKSFGPSKWERWLRLEEFAGANGLIFSPSSPSPSYPGAIFGLGHSRKSVDHVRAAKDRFFDMGNYTYVTGSGKSRRRHDWGFLALSLDRSLPHMVLDSRANNTLIGTNLPATFRKDQVLSLEGDFDKYFTLYCPKEYERDALYVFTPDLMALLIDNAAPFDVEIVDKWMFVYSSKPFAPIDPAHYQRLFRIIDTIGAKALSQTDRYSDERINDFSANVVAPQGRRLSRGINLVSVAIIVVAAVIWAWPFLSRIFG